MAESGKRTERGCGFWNAVTVKMKSVAEEPWLEHVRMSQSLPDLSVGNRLDQEAEDIGYKLTIVGPLVDFFLKHIGQAIRLRLRKARRTGLMNDFSTTIPMDLMKYICVLWRNYGGTISTDVRRKQMLFTSTRFSTLEKIFSPARFSGENYLKKRHYSKIRQPIKSPGKSRFVHVFEGRSAVVVSEKTPFTISFKMEQGTAKISFYRQNYDRNGIAEDLTLQGLINS